MEMILAKLDLCLSCGYNTIFIYGTFIIIFHLRKLILRELDLADLERKLLHNLLTIFFFGQEPLYEYWDSKLLMQVVSSTEVVLNWCMACLGRAICTVISARASQEGIKCTKAKA